MKRFIESFNIRNRRFTLLIAAVLICAVGIALADPRLIPSPSMFKEKTEATVDVSGKQNVWHVTVFDKDDGSEGTMRWAVEQAVAKGGKHLIVLKAGGIYGSEHAVGKTINITGIPILIEGDLNLDIQAVGASEGTGSASCGGNTIKRTSGTGGIFKIIGDKTHGPKIRFQGLVFEGATTAGNRYDSDRSNDSAIQIRGEYTRVEVIGCTFRNNRAIGGGAIYGRGGRLYARNTLFQSNHSLYGGAVDVSDMDATFKACSFKDNTASTGDMMGRGGALFVGGFVDGTHDKLTIEGCSFTNNGANLHGGALCVNSIVREAVITNTTFAGNWVLQKGANWACGGAVYFENSNNDRGTRRIESCTIVGNTAIYDGYHVEAAAIGGGIYANTGKYQAVEVRNSIIVGNSTSVTDAAQRGENNAAFHAEHDGKDADIYGSPKLMGYNLAAVVSENTTKTAADTVNPDFSDSTKGLYFVNWLSNVELVSSGWTTTGTSFDISEEKTGPMAGAYGITDTVAVATIPLKDTGTKDSLINNPAFSKIPASELTTDIDARAFLRAAGHNGDIGAAEIHLDGDNIIEPSFVTYLYKNPTGYQYVPLHYMDAIAKMGFLGFIEGIKNYGNDYVLLWAKGFTWTGDETTIPASIHGVDTVVPYKVGAASMGPSIYILPAYMINGKAQGNYFSSMMIVKESEAPDTIDGLSFDKKEFTVREGEAIPVQLLIASADVTDPRMIWSVSSADNILRATAADADDPEYGGWAWVKGLHKGSATLTATSIRSMEEDPNNDEYWATAACTINVAYPASAVYIKNISIESSAEEFYLDSSAQGTLRVVFDKSDPDQAVNVPYSVEWSVSDETMATVKQRASNPVWASLTPLKTGTVIVTAKVTQGGELQEKDIYKATYTVVIKTTGGGDVVDETPEGAAVSPVKPSLSVSGIVTASPEFAADADVTAALIGTGTSNITADSKGNLTLKNSLVSKAAGQAVAAAVKAGKLEAGTAVEGAQTLPIFTAAGNEPREVIAAGFAVSGDVLAAETPKDVRLLKVFPDDREGALFDFAAVSDDYKDKTFTVLDSANAVPEKIVSGDSYTLVVFIKDCGDFDLDNMDNGSVTDPVALLRTKSTGGDNSADGSSSSCGGCNAGYGLLALLALVPAALRRKKG